MSDPVLRSISPAPTDEEAAAIVSAVEALASSGCAEPGS